MKNALGMLKGKSKLERLEGYAIAALVIGTAILALGIGLTIINTQGISAILAMAGALISFFSVVSLVAVWILKEVFGE